MQHTETYCGICNEPLHHDGITFVHPGGGNYVQWCFSCKWRGSRRGLTACPQCGKSGRTLRDDHCALPVQRITK